MTNSIRAYGELLTASENDRVLTYKLLPFLESGRTNKGSVTVSKGAVKIPSDISHLVLNTEHKQDAPVGRFISVEEREDALYASVTLSDFERGNVALQAARSGELTGISVEVRNPVIRNGVMHDGELTGAALCKTPAFSNALLMASDTGDINEKIAAIQEALTALADSIAPESAPDEEPAVEPEETPSEDAPEDPAVEDDERKKTLFASTGATTTKEDTMSETPAAPAAEFLAASASGATPKSALEEFSNLLVDGSSLSGSGMLTAAVTQVSNTNTFDKTAVPDYVGELWQVGRNYSPKFISLLKQETLVSKKIQGWKFDVAPQTSFDYAGFPAQLSSNSPTTVEATGEFFEEAGGHELDRASLALADGGFMAGYLRESTDDWARKTDARVLTKIKATSLAVTGVGGTAYHKLLVGAQLLNETATPEWIIVGSALWLEIMETVDATKLSLLGASIGLNEGQVANIRLIPAPLSETGLANKIIVGNSNALHFYSLPGGPVRADVLNLVNNGVIKGVWGMGGFLEHDRRGIITVS